ncbi:ribosome biogenesis factor YjgA [Marinobacter sp. X15-166B]|uniref:ribosome biogenesis factor YjgA n=1 Tax=Marinobacter sp. X15-166B TaxID=1897620 RepID=UPI00085C2F64|nr:ribosome biogenesis factor YjgA [Marinobacter sp. X15-166B]OEY65208.1 hypothetical protein BG841_01160 [Marinobacter sp. X15-166B]
MTDHHPEPDAEHDYGPSKSQLKREMHALQDLGKRMLALSKSQLDTLPISDRLKRALEESARIKQHEARRRHLQYIGKIIRSEDDIDALTTAIDAFNVGSEEHTRRLHIAEHWRERLLNEGNAAVNAFLQHCPEADVQHLRNLARNARRDLQKPQATGHSRKLFRYLRECLDDARQGQG